MRDDVTAIPAIKEERGRKRERGRTIRERRMINTKQNKSKQNGLTDLTLTYIVELELTYDVIHLNH